MCVLACFFAGCMSCGCARWLGDSVFVSVFVLQMHTQAHSLHTIQGSPVHGRPVPAHACVCVSAATAVRLAQDTCTYDPAHIPRARKHTHKQRERERERDARVRAHTHRHTHARAHTPTHLHTHTHTHTARKCSKDGGGCTAPT